MRIKKFGVEASNYRGGKYTTHKAEGNSHRAMKARCYNPNYWAYKHYGGRGIKVCERWLGRDGFANFLEDMGKKPSPKHSLDRVDNDGDYEPSNCRWSTQRAQVRNSSKCRFVTIGGVVRPITEWCAVYKIAIGSVYNRLGWGWSEVDAITTPVNPSGKHIVRS